MRHGNPKVIIRKDGIVAPQIGFVQWADIKLIQFRDVSSSDNSQTNLDIFLSEKEKWQHPEFTIMIDLLDKKEKEIADKITEFHGVKPNKV